MAVASSTQLCYLFFCRQIAGYGVRGEGRWRGREVEKQRGGEARRSREKEVESQGDEKTGRLKGREVDRQGG